MIRFRDFDTLDKLNEFVRDLGSEIQPISFETLTVVYTEQRDPHSTAGNEQTLTKDNLIDLDKVIM